MKTFRFSVREGGSEVQQIGRVHTVSVAQGVAVTHNHSQILRKVTFGLVVHVQL